MKESLVAQIKVQVDQQIAQHIPVALEQRLDELKAQLREVKIALQNSYVFLSQIRPPKVRLLEFQGSENEERNARSYGSERTLGGCLDPGGEEKRFVPSGYVLASRIRW